MNNPLNLDLRARAELLAYLVSSHLLARQLTGAWLSSDHVVESTTLWLKTNGGGADVVQRVMLSSRALEVARQLETAPLPAFSPTDAKLPDGVAAIDIGDLSTTRRTAMLRNQRATPGAVFPERYIGRTCENFRSDGEAFVVIGVRQ